VGLSYLPKNPRFMKMIGQQALEIDVQDPDRPLDLAELTAKMRDAFERRAEISRDLELRLAPIVQQARDTARYAAELIGVASALPAAAPAVDQPEA
jgi:uncharacterized protein YigA (DUF484 family)